MIVLYSLSLPSASFDDNHRQAAMSWCRSARSTAATDTAAACKTDAWRRITRTQTDKQVDCVYVYELLSMGEVSMHRLVRRAATTVHGHVLHRPIHCSCGPTPGAHVHTEHTAGIKYTWFVNRQTQHFTTAAVFNILRYFVHQRLLVPFGLGVLLSCMFVCLCLLPTVLYVWTEF